jgi:Family of unknown function (DUF5681)
VKAAIHIGNRCPDEPPRATAASATAVLNRHAAHRRKPGLADQPEIPGLKPWKKGQSGNPKGRPKDSKNKIGHHLAFDTLERIMKSKRSPAALRLKAAKTFIKIAGF